MDEGGYTGVLHVEPIARSKRCEASAASSSVGNVDTRPSEIESAEKIVLGYIVVSSPLHEVIENEEKVGKLQFS